jgi:hypothetical protein
MIKMKAFYRKNPDFNGLLAKYLDAFVYKHIMPSFVDYPKE